MKHCCFIYYWIWVDKGIIHLAVDCSLVLYSAGSGVNSVEVVLSGLIMRLLSFVHVCNCRYGCMYALAAFLLVCVDIMVMSYAYEVSYSGGAGGYGMPDVYILTSVDDATPNWCYVGERSEMDLYELFMVLYGFGMGIMFANFHVCMMLFLFNAMLYMLVRYVSPRGPMFFWVPDVKFVWAPGSCYLCCVLLPLVSVMLCDCSLSIDMSMHRFMVCV